MQGNLREVFEVKVDGPSETYRVMYYPLKDSHEPIAVLHVFKKKATKGIATPKTDLDLIKARLREVKECENE
jgi:phage-related protein